jgi:YbbR domain-containing protein
MLVSLFLSILLWLQVQSQVEPGRQKEFEVELGMENVPEGLVVVSAPRRAVVVASGPSDVIDRIRADQILATVNLSEGEIGPGRYAIDMKIPGRPNARFELRQPTAAVSLARETRVEREVRLETLGSLSSDLVYGEGVVDPPTVTVIGPEPNVAQIEKTRVMLDLARVRPGEAYPLTVELLGRNNRPIPLVKAVPSTVTVRSGVAAAPAQRRVLIAPLWRGQPEFGYRVTGYEVRPNQIQISGESARLASIVSLDTEPFDLSGLTSDAMRKVRVPIPSGMRSATREVEVTVRISPVPQ